MNELPKRQDFLKQLNTMFRVFLDGQQPTEVRLKEVSEMRQKSKYEAFSLIFAAPKDIFPQPLLYRVEHDTLGAMELFMGPVEETEDSYLLEALFNQRIIAAND
jgi:hypothetical protein